MLNQHISLNELLTISLNTPHLSLDVVAKTYFGLSLKTFKKHLNEDPFLQQLGINIKQGIITIDELSAIFNNARDKSTSKLQALHKTANFDSHDVSIAQLIFIRGLVKKFDSPIIPYLKVAEEIFGWHSSRTAIAKYHDGTLDMLQLITMHLMERNNNTIFVNVYDLANFISLPKKVILS
jgi:hypothetical protein